MLSLSYAHGGPSLLGRSNGICGVTPALLVGRAVTRPAFCMSGSPGQASFRSLSTWRARGVPEKRALCPAGADRIIDSA